MLQQLQLIKHQVLLILCSHFAKHMYQEVCENSKENIWFFLIRLVQRRNSGKSTGLIGFASSTVSSLIDQVFQPVQSSLIWVRMLAVFFLLKSKQINDLVLNKLQQKRVLTAAPQRLLIFVGTFLEYFIGRIRPDDRTLAELKKSQQQNRASQPSYFVNR